MKVARNIFHFFIYSNLFIACCAVLMVFQVYELFLSYHPPVELIAFIFFATVCSYSFHWYLTPVVSGSPSSRERWLSANRNIHMTLLVLGFTGVAVASFFLLDHWIWLLVSAFITFLYSAPKIPHPWFRALRKVALAKTIFLAFVWMYVTTILPLEISGEAWKPEFYVFAAGRFFLIYAICIIFDYRDREHDRENGIRSLITWLEYKSITRLFIASLLVFVIFTCIMFQYDFSGLTVFALLIPGIITGLLYRYASRHFSDMLYYFILDGLMALSSLITIFVSL